jgi:hypothetical protein
MPYARTALRTLNGRDIVSPVFRRDETSCMDRLEGKGQPVHGELRRVAEKINAMDDEGFRH